MVARFTSHSHMYSHTNIWEIKPSKFLNTKRRAVQIFYKVLLCGIIIRRRFRADPMRASFYLFLVCL
jgi:hypothetical protein